MPKLEDRKTDQFDGAAGVSRLADSQKLIAKVEGMAVFERNPD